MVAVTLRMPVDVVEDLKLVAPALGHSGYQPLIRAYVGRGLREDLERLEGSDLEALPTRQRVDFAGLVDLTELVTAATIPNGTYVSASIRLDYANADVSVEVNGAPGRPALLRSKGDATLYT